MKIDVITQVHFIGDSEHIQLSNFQHDIESHYLGNAGALVLSYGHISMIITIHELYGQISKYYGKLYF